MKNAIKAGVLILLFVLSTGCEPLDKKTGYAKALNTSQTQYQEGDLVIHKLTSDTLMFIRESSGGTSLLLRDKTHEARSFKKFEVTRLK